MSELMKSERDCLAGLGLLASTYIHFDPELVRGKSVSHAYGFNVNCLVIDNADGEVVAIERNRIYADNNSLQHAEQVGIRAAMDRLHAKRPRDPGMPVDEYLSGHLFMEKGTAPEDFLNKGVTLYNTYDPCAMCAVTLLTCRMKRIAYLFADKQFETVYDMMRKFYPGRDSVKEPLAVPDGKGSAALSQGAALILRLRGKVTKIEERGIPLVRSLDQAECRDDLREATALLANLDESQLSTSGSERTRNARTLGDIKRLLNIN
jgi:tRNA(Arg) A34 adenosine deaminase TadA